MILLHLSSKMLQKIVDKETERTVKMRLRK